MSLSASRTALAALTKELSGQWHQTKEAWRDAKAQEFDARYLEELRASVDTALTVIDELDKLMAKVRRDCE
jgi:Cdc6-like AAA superfamily ATPase